MLSGGCIVKNIYQQIVDNSVSEGDALRGGSRSLSGNFDAVATGILMATAFRKVYRCVYRILAE